ncbi:MAG: hypothetical protein BGN88_10160 [Clostridiales bacterium 43-6]|nr:MAG: hypothetical protein BGN88_10160 [Clostridiales bacterium 43-6]
MVWNYGEHMPLAMMTVKTAFFLQGVGTTADIVTTDSGWKTYHNTAYTPITDAGAQVGNQYLVVPPGDHLDGARYPWGFDRSDFDDSTWVSPVKTDGTWRLSKREIPWMEHTAVRFAAIKNHDKADFINGGAYTVPARSSVSFLLDNGVLTNAYPVLMTSGGKHSEIKITYNEAMYDRHLKKTHRDRTDGLQVLGVNDCYLPDGGKERVFTTLWYRTYRYVLLTVTTEEEPLTIHDFYGIYTAYPFTQKASFACGNETLDTIWAVAWRTVLLCAHETYMDCPYYEQAQYLGDTRIQALISLYITGDDRLMREALRIFRSSVTEEGLTLCCYPAGGNSIIPTFSLLWINMLHDYFMHRSDDDFLAEFLPDMGKVLIWFENRIDPDMDLLGELTHWNFVDWAWPYDPAVNAGGIPRGANTGERHSAIVTLQLVYALQAAAEIYAHFGLTEQTAHNTSLAERLNRGVFHHCFDNKKGLLSDTPDRKEFSCHANILGVLTDCVGNDVMSKVLEDKSLRDVTLYFRFYLNRAMKKAGAGERYMDSLESWVKILSLGFTTFPEIPDVDTRSDCHAWSASPLYDYFYLLAGIRPTAPGFREISVSPSFNGLPFLKASMPHPRGEIVVDLKQENGRVTGFVTIPPDTTGIFEWNGTTLPLRPGNQEINL